jgi:cellulose synthase/poly-beta-1,6-N-acetylglucosamine synthase-like glycosyltransferase
MTWSIRERRLRQMTEILESVFAIVTNAILVYFFLINAFYFLFIILSLFGIFHYRNITTYLSFKDIFQLPLVKPISVIAPAYNEEKAIISSVKSLLSLEYPLYEVVVVNDGSTDSTLEKLIGAFHLVKTSRVFRRTVESKPVRGIYTSPEHPNLIVVDKINGGCKADAMNAGLNVSRYPLFCAVDCDSLLEKDALLKVVRPFLEDPERTVATGGIIRLSNGCSVKGSQVTHVELPKNFLARFQIIEYLRAFLGGRIGMGMMRSILIISGAFGLFRKDIVLECGGYRTGAVGEDMDLIVRMRKFLYEKKIPHQVRFIPDPICWTEAPESLSSLAKQRNRWHRGLIDALVYNRSMFLNPRYGITGVLAFPFYAVFEMLGPLTEIVGYIIFATLLIMGKINYPYALIFFLLAVVTGSLISLLAILLEEYSARNYTRLRDIMILSLFGLLENILFRQFLTLVRVKAYFDYFRGKKAWGSLEKKGFAEAGQRVK